MIELPLLAGDTPMMPAPPNVCALGFIAVLESELWPDVALIPNPGDPKLPEGVEDHKALPFAVDPLLKTEFELSVDDGPAPPPPFGPMPASVELPVEPIPVSG